MVLNIDVKNLPAIFRPLYPMAESDLLAFCEGSQGIEMEREPNGDIVLMTPAGGLTGRRNAYITQMLANWSDETQTGYSFDSSTGFTLPDGSMRSPDAAWIATWRWETLDRSQQKVFPHITPDFIIELRSETDRVVDVEAKIKRWLANGVALAWLIDPQLKIVSIYHQDVPIEVLECPIEVRGDGPVEGFILKMERLWA